MVAPTTTTGLTGGPTVGGIVALGSGLVFTNVTFPNDNYIATSNPVSPVSLSFSLAIPLQIGGASTPCGQTIMFKSTVQLGVGSVTLGAGWVTYTTGWIFLSNS